jgi:hypothetical protein
MIIGELWIEYHSILSIIVGVLLTFIVFNYVKYNTVYKIIIITIIMLFLTGIQGIIKFIGLIIIIGAIWYLGFIAIFVIGLGILAYLSVNYSWSLAWWQIIIFGGVWMVLSFIIDLLMNHVVVLVAVRRQLKKKM